MPEAEGGRYFLASRKYQRTCVQVGSWLRYCRGSLYEKGFGIGCESKLSLRFQAPFSVCFANPQSKLCGLPLRYGMRWERRCGGAIVYEARSFRHSETAFPRRRLQSTMRQADHAARDRIREADRKRGLEDGGQACLQSRFQVLFRKPADTPKPKDWFSGGF